MPLWDQPQILQQIHGFNCAALIHQDCINWHSFITILRPPNETILTHNDIHINT